MLELEGIPPTLGVLFMSPRERLRLRLIPTTLPMAMLVSAMLVPMVWVMLEPMGLTPMVLAMAMVAMLTWEPLELSTLLALPLLLPLLLLEDMLLLAGTVPTVLESCTVPKNFLPLLFC